MIEQFDTKKFTLVLPKKKHKVTGELKPMFDYVGIADEEHCWAMLIGKGNLRLLVRSSINVFTGLADGTGENSIRLIVQRRSQGKWISISKGPDAFTQRVPGWEKRLVAKIKTVYEQWSVVSQDFTDEEQLFVSKQPNTKGRVFAKHTVTKEFRWLS